MSKFFPGTENEGSDVNKQFIPPDYSDLTKEEELPFDSDLTGDSDDDDDDDDLDGLELDTDEEIEKEKVIEQLETNNKMTSPFGGGFGDSQNKPNSGWTWGSGASQKPSTDWWNSGGNTVGNSGGGWWNANPPNNGWGNSKSSQQEQINREKKVLFIDFFDGLMETYQSQGQPGFLPRAVYDLKPRFDVWIKLAAFSPEYVFCIAQKEFLNDINGIEGWSKVLDGWCCCLSSFLRKQYGCAQVLLSTSIYQPKDWVISTALVNFEKKDCIYIGLQSGLYNQSNQDLVTAQKCGIDYVDLNQLLNNMF